MCRMPSALLQLLRQRAAVRRYSPRTAEVYERWVIAYVRYHRLRHPRDLGGVHVREFLVHLAEVRRVAPSTQNQARAALQFLYRDVLEAPLPLVAGVSPVSLPHRLPNVLSRVDVQRVLAAMHGVPRTMAMLLYGSGLRLMECCALRVKDVDFKRGEIVVRRGKGDRDRVTMLPESVVEDLQAQVLRCRRIQLGRSLRGGAYVEMPDALDRKLGHAIQSWPFMWVFPASRDYLHEASGQRRLHHIHPTVLQRAVTDAARRVGLAQRVGCHTFRHCFATHLLEAHYDIRTVQELLGHRDVSTTMLYTRVLNRGGLGVRSPLDVSGNARG